MVFPLTTFLVIFFNFMCVLIGCCVNSTTNSIGKQSANQNFDKNELCEFPECLLLTIFKLHFPAFYCPIVMNKTRNS